MCAIFVILAHHTSTELGWHKHFKYTCFFFFFGWWLWDAIWVHYNFLLFFACWALLMDIFTRFIKEYPSCNVRLWAFEKLEPFYVRRLRNCNTYTYKYYVEMVELLPGFNNMKTSSKGIHGRYCEFDCDVCSRSMVLGQFTIEHYQFLGLGDMWGSIYAMY